MTATTPDLVLLAGVPGAGKTETLRRVTRIAPQLRTADPATYRSWTAEHLPWLPYAWCRPVIHTLAHLAVIVRILLGRSPIVIHDPGTRDWTRRLFLRLALLRQHRPALVLIDVERREALAGQTARGRVLPRRAFDRHWRRWRRLRARILAGGEPTAGEGWPVVRIVSRDEAVATLLSVLGIASGDPPPTDRPAKPDTISH